MTCWFCDRCGKQVKKNSYGAGKYNIQKSFFIHDEYECVVERSQRALKFCDDCARKVEDLLDNEFSQLPKELVVTNVTET